MTRLLLLLGLGLTASVPVLAETRHEDQEAGISFSLPFSNVQVKTGAQVEALILETSDVTIPSGIRFTSGYYSNGDAPFVLIWIKPEPHLPSYEYVMRLSRPESREAFAASGLRGLLFNPKRLRGNGRLETKSGLRARVMVQMQRGHMSFLGFYYRKPAELELFKKILASFKVSSAHQIQLSDLPREKSLWDGILGGEARRVATFADVLERRFRQIWIKIRLLFQ